MTLLLSRRSLVQAVALAAAAPTLLRGSRAEAAALKFGPAEAFSFEGLVERAREMAGKPYVPPARPAPDVVFKIDYEQLGKIRFKPDDALFANGPGVYPATFFHLGRFAPKSVRMHAVEGGKAREILYSPSYFDMPASSPAHQLPPDAGFAGFRFQEARTRSDWRTQDWVAFQGASYFRAIGALGQYGMSARGLALDVAAPTPEEFPDFTDFWLESAPAAGQPATVHALLSGPSVAGAFRFLIARGTGVVMDIDCEIFMRQPVFRLGLAPLTSMFWYAEYNRPYLVDWRPEVHDSDGLAIWNGKGERLWRVLNNPDRVIVSSFVDENPRGFGLLQRDRNFEHYLDGVRYDRRPSVWVEPKGGWGPGAVQLVEIPTDDEIHDNIVAFWVPRDPARAGDRHKLSYRLYWLADEPFPADNVARAVATRIGRGGEPGKPRPRAVRKFVVEFAGGPLRRLPADAKPEPVISSSRGTISYVFAEQVPDTDRWRAQFDLTVDGPDPAELRCYLRLGDRPLTETWLYQDWPQVNR